MKNHSKQGFTLIELMVVIAIISVLASIIITNVNLARQKAADSLVKQQLRQIIIALNIYKNDFGRYPPEGETSANTVCFRSSGTCGWGGALAAPALMAAIQPYIPNVPAYPAPWNDNYWYIYYGLADDVYLPNYPSVDNVQTECPAQDEKCSTFVLWSSLEPISATNGCAPPNFLVGLDTTPGVEAYYCWQYVGPTY